MFAFNKRKKSRKEAVMDEWGLMRLHCPRGWRLNAKGISTSDTWTGGNLNSGSMFISYSEARGEPQSPKPLGISVTLGKILLGTGVMKNFPKTLKNP